MSRGRPTTPIRLDCQGRDPLGSIARSRMQPHGMAQRAGIVSACAEGSPVLPLRVVCLGISKTTVGKWRRPYPEQGMEGLQDEERPGRPPTHDDEREAEVINTALHGKPPPRTHWSVRTMAEHRGISKSTVHRWFKMFGVQPHRQRHVKISNHPFSVEKVRDIVGSVHESP